MFRDWFRMYFDDPPGSGGDQTVPYARFQEVVKQKNDLVAELKKLQEAAATWDTAKAAFEKSIGENSVALEAKAKELAESQQAALRLRTAYAGGLPLDLADRLQGKDEAELKADVERMKAFLKPGTPGVPPPSGGGAPQKIDLSNLTPAQIREKKSDILKQAQS